MPYVLVNVDEQQFADVQSSFTGHSVVKHVGKLLVQVSLLQLQADKFAEEDKQMRTQ